MIKYLLIFLVIAIPESLFTQNLFKEQDIPLLTAKAIVNGIDDGLGVKRDISAFLSWLYYKQPNLADSLISLVRRGIAADSAVLKLFLEIESKNDNLSPNNTSSTLTSNNPDGIKRLANYSAALKLLSEIELSYKKLPPNTSFGPVSSTTPGAIERLALLVRITEEIAEPLKLQNGVADFSLTSSFDSNTVIIAKKIQTTLSFDKSIDGLYWRDEVIPALLQKGWDNISLINSATTQESVNEFKITKMYLTPWLDKRYRSLNELAEPHQNSFRAIGSHPMILSLIHDRIFTNLDEPETRKFCTWLSEEAILSPENAFTSGLFLLQAATRKGVKTEKNGNIIGDAFWVNITKKILDAIVVGSDTGIHVPKPWQGKAIRLNELYCACRVCNDNILGSENLGAVLYYYGQIRMKSIWNKFNIETAERANDINNNEVPDIQVLKSKATISQDVLYSVMANPFCAPWLPVVSENDNPKSLEAGILLRWFMSQLSPRDLYKALVMCWEPKINSDNKLVTAHDRLLAVDDFSAWEMLRGSWIGKTSNGAPVIIKTRSPWIDISLSTIIKEYENAYQNGSKNNSYSKPQIHDALATLCWFGNDNLPNLLQNLHNEIYNTQLDGNEKVFLQTCRLNLMISKIIKDKNFDETIQDNELPDTGEINNLYKQVNDLYVDGRPLLVRTAVDITLLLCKQVVSIQNLKLDTLSFYYDNGYLDLRTSKIRDACKNMLQKVEPLILEAVTRANAGKEQSGIGLALAELVIELHQTYYGEKATSSSKDYEKYFQSLSNNGLNINDLGTGYWGIEAWLGQWKRDLKTLKNKRIFNIDSETYNNKLQRTFIKNIGGAMVLLDNQNNSNLFNIKNYSDFGFWSNYFFQNNSINNGDNLQISIPWVNSQNPSATMKLISDRANIFNLEIIKQTVKADLDSRPQNSLPKLSWANGLTNLGNEITELQRIERNVGQIYNEQDLKKSLETLKSLLAAPLIVNMSAFKEELEVAVSDVKRTEALLKTRKFEYLAAKIEFDAQKLLTSVFGIEKKRTDLLIRIKDHEFEIDSLNTIIADNNSKISKLNINNSETNQEIAKLKEDIRKDEDKKKKIEVEMAATVVNTLTNELELLMDLIYKPTPNPDINVEPKMLPGILGVIAYNADKQCTSELNKLRNQKEENKKQLEELHEASFFKAITTVIGVVVGGIIGGPEGMQMGAMIGKSAGELVIQVKQGKPIGDILKNTMQSGMQIAQSSGLEINTDVGNYALKEGELKDIIKNAENTIGPVLKDLPTYIDLNSLNVAMSLTGPDIAVNKAIAEIRDNTLTKLKDVQIPIDNDKLCKIVKDVVLTGSPEEMLDKLKSQITDAMKDMPINDNFRKTAAELGISIDETIDDMNSNNIKEKIAGKLATLSLARMLPTLIKKREKLLQNLLIALTSVQDILKKSQSSINIADLLQSDQFKNTFSEIDYKNEIIWIKSAFQNIRLAPGQEIPWGEIYKMLNPLLSELFPNDPERKAYILGKFKKQLDFDGMQAEIQRILNPWNLELNNRLGEVDKKLALPCNYENDEERLGCQIGNIENGIIDIQANVLGWLKNGNSKEYVELKNEVSKKMEALERAKKSLIISELDWNIAGEELKIAGFLKSNADLEVDIAKISSASVSLIFPCAAFSIFSSADSLSLELSSFNTACSLAKLARSTW